MLRSFELRLNVNRSQATVLEFVLADSCETYNAALQERIDAWKLQRKSISLYDQFKELTELRQDPRFATLTVEVQRDPLCRVDRAFRDFFRRCKAGEKPGHPPDCGVGDDAQQGPPGALGGGSRWRRALPLAFCF